MIHPYRTPRFCVKAFCDPLTTLIWVDDFLQYIRILVRKRIYG